MVKRGYYRFVPIWFDDMNCEIITRQLWLDPILDIVLWFDIIILNISEFKIYIEKT